MNPERENLCSGLSCAAWGYFLLHFDFNLGTVSVLPRFAGFLLLLSAIDKLSGERRDLRLLQPLCVLLAGWNAADWLFSWAGADLNGIFPPLDLIAAAAGLYFHFQFLTDMAALAERYQPEGERIDRKLLRRRTVYVALLTVIDLFLDLPAEWIIGTWREYAVPGLALVGMAAAVFVMSGLFALRRSARGESMEKDI